MVVIMLTAGQVLWKTGLLKIGGFKPSAGLRAGLMSLGLSPYILAGLVLYIVATVLWLYVLSNVPLSLAYPLMSVSYVLGVVAGAVVFKESVPATRWLGAAVVCGGAYLISRR